MSGFEEARRHKIEEINHKKEADEAAAKERHNRLGEIDQKTANYFAGYQDIGTKIMGDTLTIHRGIHYFIDVTALDGDRYKVQVGGVDMNHVGYEIVRNGKTVEGDEVYRIILDWFDGDL